MNFETKNILMVGAAFLAISYLIDFRNVPVIGAFDVIDRDAF